MLPRTRSLMLTLALSCTLAAGCATQSAPTARNQPQFDCSPGKPVAMGVGDFLGAQLYTHANPEVALAPYRVNNDLATVNVNE